MSIRGKMKPIKALICHVIGVAMGDLGAMLPKIFKLSSHVVF